MGPNTSTVSHVRVYLLKSPCLCPLKSLPKFNSSFTLPETDSGTDSDSDSKPDDYFEQAHIAQTQTLIPTHYFCTGQESEFQSITESVFRNVNEP